MEVLNISTSGLFKSSLKFLQERMEAHAKNCCITTKLEITQERNQLFVSYDNSNSKVNAVLTDAIAEVVITDCKYHYIESSLTLPIEDGISRHAFIRALSNFDRATDKIIAKSLVKITPNFLLDSFYTFSLDALKKRWQEACALANDNACFLVCDGTFRELLRFLISNLETRVPEVHLFQRAGEVEVLTRNLKPASVYVGDELSGDAQVISKLIDLAPKRIFLHQDVNTAMQDCICNLFGGCVQVVQN